MQFQVSNQDDLHTFAPIRYAILISQGEHLIDQLVPIAAAITGENVFPVDERKTNGQAVSSEFERRLPTRTIRQVDDPEIELDRSIKCHYEQIGLLNTYSRGASTAETRRPIVR